MTRTAPMRFALALAAAALLAVALLTSVSAPADAHRSGCHGAHSCPSDHATYAWRGLVCISPASGERRRSPYTHRVAYGGRVYYCRSQR